RSVDRVFEWRSLGTSSLDFRSARRSSCPMNRFTNCGICSATAQIPTHRLVNVCIAWVRLTRKKSRGGHYLPGLAVTALRHICFDPGPLHGMNAVGRKTFYCRYVLSGNRRYRSSARACRNTVDMNGTCAAKLQSATKLCAGQAE